MNIFAFKRNIEQSAFVQEPELVILSDEHLDLVQGGHGDNCNGSNHFVFSDWNGNGNWNDCGSSHSHHHHRHHHSNC